MRRKIVGQRPYVDLAIGMKNSNRRRSIPGWCPAKWTLPSCMWKEICVACVGSDIDRLDRVLGPRARTAARPERLEDPMDSPGKELTRSQTGLVLVKAWFYCGFSYSVELFLHAFYARPGIGGSVSSQYFRLFRSIVSCWWMCVSSWYFRSDMV